MWPSTKPVAKLLSWQHGGFCVDNQVRIEAGDSEGRQQVARYMVRAPFSLDKTEYKAEQGVVVYRPKLHATIKHRPQIIPSAKELSPVEGLPPIRCPLRVELGHRGRSSGVDRATLASHVRTLRTVVSC